MIEMTLTHRYTQAVLYRAESVTTVREAVIAAVAAGADLAGADLARAPGPGVCRVGATMKGRRILGVSWWSRVGCA